MIWKVPKNKNLKSNTRLTFVVNGATKGIFVDRAHTLTPFSVLKDILIEQTIMLLWKQPATVITVLGNLCHVVAQGGLQMPEPTGPYITGVHDFEFTDKVYPSDHAGEENGRRIMVRVWYPACLKTRFNATNNTCGPTIGLGRRRRYMEEGEFDAIAQPQIAALGMLFPMEKAFSGTKEAETSSYIDAPPLSSFPTVVFNHGGLGYVSQNTAMMEDMASHGLVMYSVTHPTGSSGIQYPNGDVARYDDEYFADILSEFGGNPQLNSGNITERYLARRVWYENPVGLISYIPRWRDDLIATVDFLQEGNHTGILSNLTFGGVEKVVYGGMSYGAAAAGSASQVDLRSVATWNLDGTHSYIDLFDTAVRVPYLLIMGELNGRDPETTSGYTNEFVLEELVTMGEDERVERVQVDGVSHFEFSDFMFAPLLDRVDFPNGGTVNGTELHDMVTSFCLGFSMRHLAIDESWTPELSYQEHSIANPLNAGYVGEWARSNPEVFEVVQPPTDSPATGSPTDSPVSGAPTDTEDTSRATISSRSDAMFVTAAVGALLWTLTV